MKIASTIRRFLAGFILLAAFAICAAIVVLAGQNPLVALQSLVNGAAGSQEAWAESGAKTIPLVLTGLAVAVAFRAGFWNIGAEGQFVLGALGATILGAKFGLPVPIVVLGGALAGALWAGIAGWLKWKRGAPEIITTIMLNYIALQIVTWALQGPLQERLKSEPKSDVLPIQSQIPALVADTNLHWGLFLAVFCAVGCWWILFRTQRGFFWRAAGQNPVAAQVAGLPLEKSRMSAVLWSGALAGLGGALEVAGATKQLYLGGFGYGYTAIAVAILAGLNPLWVVPSALVFGMLNAGGGALERDAGVPAVAVSVVTGVIIFVMAALPKLRRES